MKSSNLLIEYQCPQCGAPSVLEETDRLFTCEFCRVKSYLIGGKFFRYVLPKSPDITDKPLIYFPYWRFKGMSFFCLPDEVAHNFIDVSYQAAKSVHFPNSLGLRSQALKLRFMTPEIDATFIKPSLSIPEIMTQIESRFNRFKGKPILEQAFIGETLSLIYSPFYIQDNKLYDAVLKQPVSSLAENDYPGHLEESKPDWRIQFIPTLCPDCGWDMQGERDTLTLTCRNCNSIWKATGNKLKKLSFGCIPGDQDDQLYLPFWRIKADVTKIQLRSYADMVRVGNLPKVVQDAWEDVQFYFWVPAFKMTPNILLRLSLVLTVSQPQMKFEAALSKGNLYPVTLPVTEAVETLKMNLASFLRPQSLVVEKLKDITITPKQFLLVYIPFHEGHHEFIHREYHMVVHKNILKFATNL